MPQKIVEKSKKTNRNTFYADSLIMFEEMLLIPEKFSTSWNLKKILINGQNEIFEITQIVLFTLNSSAFSYGNKNVEHWFLSS